MYGRLMGTSLVLQAFSHKAKYCYLKSQVASMASNSNSMSIAKHLCNFYILTLLGLIFY